MTDKLTDAEKRKKREERIKKQQEEQYIVCWMETDPNDNSKYVDHYKVFIHGDNIEKYIIDPKASANRFYKDLLQKEEVYSANICLIIDSSDY